MKVKLTNIFVLFCLIIGFGVIIANGEVFTAHSLIETILCISSLLFFLFKYSSSAIIVKYQDSAYKPAKGIHILNDILVNMCVYVIQPICLNLLYACVPLLIIKFAAPDKLGILAELTYKIYRFNQDHIKEPTTIILIIVSLLTLFNFLSLKYFKKAKSFVKFITLPFGTIAILVFFINIDSGISPNYISWRININKPKYISEKLTFNAEQKENAKAIINAYVETTVAKLFDNKRTEFETSGDSIDITILTYHLKNLVNQEVKEPFIKLDLYEGNAYSKELYENKDRQTIDRVLRNLHSNTTGKSWPEYDDLFEIIKPENSSKYHSFLSILNDGKRTIGPTPEIGKNETILKELIKSNLVDRFLGQFVDKIHFYPFIKDPAFDLIKSKFMDGFSYLLKKGLNNSFTKEDLNEVNIYLLNSLKNDIERIENYIKDKKILIVGFDKKYTKAIQARVELRNGMFNNDQALKELIASFPNDPNIEIWKFLDVSREMKKNKSAVQKINFEFWKKYLADNKGIQDYEEFSKVIDKYEEMKYLDIAENSHKAAAWQDFIDRYPNYPGKNIIFNNIEICKQNEALEYASNTGTQEAWNDYLAKYPNDPNIAKYMEDLHNNDYLQLRKKGILGIENNISHLNLVPVETESVWQRAKKILVRLRF